MEMKFWCIVSLSLGFSLLVKIIVNYFNGFHNITADTTINKGIFKIYNQERM